MTKIETLMEMFKLGESKDFTEMYKYYDKDVEIVIPGDPWIPGAGIYKGLQAFQDYSAELRKVLDMKRIVSMESYENEHKVIMEWVNESEVIKTGEIIEIKIIAIFTFENNKVIRHEVCFDTLMLARRAFGLKL
ncbi:nuclear transport factor 2 family protein [bacterium]|nr:nuclear transport factor 2 family protein [bacterium]